MKRTMILLSLLLAAGCNPKEEKKAEAPASTAPTTAPTETPIPALKLGEHVSNGFQYVTPLKMRKAAMIDELGNKYQVTKAKAGEQFIIIEYLVENQDKSSYPMSRMVNQPKIVDSDGYTYSEDLMATLTLKKQLKDGAIPGGAKTRGEIAIPVPLKAKGLKLYPGAIGGVENDIYPLE